MMRTLVHGAHSAQCGCTLLPQASYTRPCACALMADQDALANVEEKILEVEQEIKDVRQEIKDVKKWLKEKENGRSEDE